MKKHGWIFQMKGKSGVYSSGWGFCLCSIPTTRRLSEAVVVETRKEARFVKTPSEVIRKVELKNGKPKKIIPGR